MPHLADMLTTLTSPPQSLGFSWTVCEGSLCLLIHMVPLVNALNVAHTGGFGRHPKLDSE